MAKSACLCGRETFNMFSWILLDFLLLYSNISSKEQKRCSTLFLLNCLTPSYYWPQVLSWVEIRWAIRADHVEIDFNPERPIEACASSFNRENIFTSALFRHGRNSVSCRAVLIRIYFYNIPNLYRINKFIFNLFTALMTSWSSRSSMATWNPTTFSSIWSNVGCLPLKCEQNFGWLPIPFLPYLFSSGLSLPYGPLLPGI